jgi:hypothetical protein
MSSVITLSVEQKLTLTYRVEPGCLGPTGADRIEGFCAYAQSQMQSIDADCIHWNITPRFDKSLPEMAYQVLGKRMTQQQAEKYLAHFGKRLDDLEGHLTDKLAELIATYKA